MRLGLVVTLCLAAACQEPGCCIDPSPGPLLVVAPDRLLDSATVGSSTPQVMALDITNAGDGQLRWQVIAKHASPWLTLQPDTGTAGLASPHVLANPSGLAVGVYRDTIAVSGNTAAVWVVPVEFRVYAVAVGSRSQAPPARDYFGPGRSPISAEAARMPATTMAGAASPPAMLAFRSCAAVRDGMIVAAARSPGAFAP